MVSTIAAGTLVAAGIALRLWQYFGRSALWTDEATLANNIVARSYARLLLEPLTHHQAAPVGFLLVEKTAITLFGVNDLALRAFPLVCSIAALLLVWRIALRLLSPGAIPLVLAPLALAPPIIFFAGDVKQYAGDLAVALALLLLALDAMSCALAGALARARVTAIALAGALLVWFSQPGVLMIAGLGAALLVDAFTADRARRAFAPVAWIVGLWGFSALAVLLVSQHLLAPGTNSYMHQFWVAGFWPLALARPASWGWPAVQTANVFAGQLGFPTSVAAAGSLFVMAGTAAQWRRSRCDTMLLGAPLIVALGAAAARLYPYDGRLAAFLVPSLLLFCAAGLDAMVTTFSPERLHAPLLAGAALVVVAMGARALRASAPVYRLEEITPAIEHLRRSATAADDVYVYYGAVPAFEFYESAGAIPGTHVEGACHRGHPREYLRELDAFRGRGRVWVLVSHEFSRTQEMAIMRDYLDAIGNARDSVITIGRTTDGAPTHTNLYLYDLSDSARWSNANAEDFPITPQPPFAARLGCPRSSVSVER